MKAMILAAGRGERMKPLTVITPKPLLMAHNTTLLAHVLHQLRDAGIQEVVMNVHHLRDQIINYCGDGAAFDLRIQYSIEEELLETGGGIYRALPLLGDESFLVVSADVWTDYPFEKLIARSTDAAHLVFVDNPNFHLQGDYGLNENNIVLDNATKKFTYASFGLLHPDLFRSTHLSIFRLTQVLTSAIQNNRVTGEYYAGQWHNVGSIADLDALRKIDCL